MKVVALAGGVGGAKLADGLAQALFPDNLTIIVNTGDDFDFLGLHICPDLDTVCYTLAGKANPETGWGLKDETWHAYESLRQLGGPDWFHLGDYDLGTHLERSRRLAMGQTLSQITRAFCDAWKVKPTVFPMTDDRVATLVETEKNGTLAFQNYFVEQQCQPVVKGFKYSGVDKAHPAPGVLSAIHTADVVIVCPSNPWVSIAPILEVPGINQAIHERPVVAVSPIISGKTVKGPAAKMFAELGFTPSASTVAQYYGPLLTAFIFDKADEEATSDIQASGIIPFATDTLMLTTHDRYRFAQEVLAFTQEMLRRKPYR